MDYQIISKGYYSYSQSNEQVTVKQFMFALKNDKKCLLLRFSNNEDCNLNGLDFVVQELDDRGNKIGEQIIKAHGLNCPANDNFSVNEDVVVHDNCTDFKVFVLAADFGDYKYSYKKDNISVSYVSNKKEDLDPAIKKQMGLNKKTISAKNFKLGSLLLLVTVIVIIAALGITWVQLDSFIDSTTVFTLDNVEYEFVNGSMDSGQILINDYKGYETNVTIPAVINGLTVVGIQEEAFANKTLTSVNIEGTVTIGNRAFANCTSLKTINLGSSSNIGYQAFYNCTSLEKIESSSLMNLGERAFEDCISLESVKLNGNTQLTIGENAFQDCSSLKNVEISQTLITSNGLQNLFANDYAIENLSIKTLGFDGTENTLHKIYGNTYADSKPYSLKTITIDSLDTIGQYFFYGFTNLETITINNLGTPTANKHSFENCYKLTNLNFKQLTNVDEAAFKNSGIKSFALNELTFLGANAFERCKDLNVDLNSYKLSYIPDYAFASCSLSKIEFPETIKTVGKYAFQYCENATKIEIPNSVLEIGLGAFEGCSKVESISLPFLGASRTAEAKLTHFAYIFGNGNSSYADTQVNVPTSLKTIKITDDILSIGDNAFYHCASVEEIDIPNSVKSIGTLAFYDCKSLKNISLSTNLQYIGNNAFASCTSLTSAYIPITVQYIGSNIFGNDTALTNITIPYIGSSKTDENNSLRYLFGTSKQTEIPSSLKVVTLLDATFIPDGAFRGLTNITNITFNSNVSSIGASAFEGCTSLNEINITANITEIKNKAFYKSGIKSITIPSNITSIGEYAFADTSLASVTFQDDLTEIKAHAFENTALTNLTIPVVDSIGDYAFASNSKLKSVVQSENSLTVSSYEFYNCSNLESITIASTVTAIGQSALENCSSLKSVSIPFIGAAANVSSTFFAYIFGARSADTGASYIPSTLKNVEITNATTVQAKSFLNLNSIKNITLNENITKIERYAFSGCSSLNFINIPSTVSTIESDVFKDCYKLVEIINSTSIELTAPNPLYIFESFEDYNDKARHFTTTDGYEFYRAGISLSNQWYLVDYDHSLSELNLPTNPKDAGNTVSSYIIINYFAKDNTNIKSVSVSQSVSSIQSYAFYGCYNIESLDFNNTSSELKTIGSNAFNYCSKITSAQLPNGITSVGNNAFAYCLSMQVVNVPGSLSDIGNDAFLGCVSLFDVYNLGSLELEMESTSYGYIAYNALLIHTNLSEPSLYDSTYGNFNFKTNGEQWILYSVIDPSISTINLAEFTSHEEGTSLYGKPFTYRVYKNIFKGKTYTSLVVSKAVIDIPASSFLNCTKLSTVDMSDATNLKSIANNLFDGCTSLTSVSFPEDTLLMSSIGEYAFRNCYLLKTALIPISVTSVGEYAFGNCYSLETVSIPSAITIINKGTFSNCYRLYDLTLPSCLITIEENAFEYCYGIAKLTLPSTLKEIKTNAFYNCTHLYEVINLSSITVTKGMADNGEVSYVAKQVTSDPTASIVNSIKTEDGLYFVHHTSKWYLYSIPGITGDGSYTFPDTVEYDSTTIDVYNVDSRAITNPQSNINKLIISTSISSFAKYWYYIPANFTGEIYYKGDKETFNTVSQKLAAFGSQITVYYYVSCVHAEGEWTIVDGKISTVVNKHVIDRQESDNCSINLLTYYKCPKCEHEYYEEGPGKHTLDENNKCTVCSWIVVNSKNLSTNEQASTIDGFSFAAPTYITIATETITIKPNKSGTKEVSITYTATKDVDIAFEYSINSGSSYTTLYILYNGVVAKEIPGTETTTKSYSKSLSAGQTVTIKFKCTASGSSVLTDKAYISGLKIKEKIN